MHVTHQNYREARIIQASNTAQSVRYTEKNELTEKVLPANGSIRIHGVGSRGLRIRFAAHLVASNPREISLVRNNHTNDRLK